MLYHLGGSLKWGGYPGTPTAAWFILEIPLKMDDLGRTPFSGNLYFDVTCFFQRNERNDSPNQLVTVEAVSNFSIGGSNRHRDSINDGFLVGGLEPWNFMTFHIYIVGISSSQLTKSYFSEG